MYQLGGQNVHYIGKIVPKRLNSVKFFNFNSEWTHEYHQEEKPQQSISAHAQSHTNRPTVQKLPKDPAIFFKSNKKVQLHMESRFAQNISDATDLHSKKKVNSQLETYKKLELSALQNRFSKPTEQIFHEEKQPQKLRLSNENELIINPIKLSGLKLPQIKTTSRQNRIIKKIKLQNLRVINIQDRIKTMKFTPEKEQNHSFDSEVTTELLKNKVKNISKLNKKFMEDRNRTEALESQEKQLIYEPTQRMANKNKTRFRKVDFEENNSVPLKKLSKIQMEKNPQNLEKQQRVKPNQNIQIQENKKEQSSLPKIQIYDKKMKIGRKKKSQEDRIRAILLQTLEKTKGTDYVAQQGTSQKKSPRDSLQHTKRSLSKQQKEVSTQRSPLILVNDPKNQGSPSKKGSLKRNQLQKIRKTLNSSNKNSQSHEPSTYVKNKKFVEMVRQVENRKHKLEELEEIKQEKTLSKEQNEEESNNQQTEKPKKAQQASSQVSQNEFLPNSARLRQKEMD